MKIPLNYYYNKNNKENVTKDLLVGHMLFSFLVNHNHKNNNINSKGTSINDVTQFCIFIVAPSPHRHAFSNRPKIIDTPSPKAVYGRPLTKIAADLDKSVPSDYSELGRAMIQIELFSYLALISNMDH